MYKSYFGWEDGQKQEMLSTCHDDTNETLCKMVDDAIFKSYTFEEFIKLDKNATEFKEFIKETKEDILDDSWF